MIHVTCAIILKGNEVLVTQRSEKMRMPLKWEFPGGKVEAGETEAECLARELREELNIEVTLRQRLPAQPYAYPDFEILLIPFLAVYVSGEIHLSEHKQYRWMEIDSLHTLDWALADVPVLEAFLNLHSHQ